MMIIQSMRASFYIDEGSKNYILILIGGIVEGENNILISETHEMP